MIIRVKKNKNYTTISNYAANDRELSYEALGLWCYLMTRPDDWTVRMADLRKRLSQRTERKTGERKEYGRDKAQAIMAELKAQGYAKMIPNRDEYTGQIKGNCWAIYEAPGQKPEIPVDGHTDNRVFRQTGKPESGKHGPLLNTDTLLNTEVVGNSSTSTPDYSPLKENCVPAYQYQALPAEEKPVALELLTEAFNRRDPISLITGILNLIPLNDKNDICMRFALNDFDEAAEAYAQGWLDKQIENGKPDAIIWRTLTNWRNPNFKRKFTSSLHYFKQIRKAV